MTNNQEPITKNQQSMTKKILLTIDLEDWFQVENFKSYIPYESWGNRELRIEKNTNLILDLLDSVELKNGNKPKATFFILGWLAERFPTLVKEIASRGHEVASHGYHHHLCSSQSKRTLIHDLIDSKKLLEDITGSTISGYRAPSFDINDDILKIVEDCGYLYDSSYNSFSAHGRYGTVDLNSFEKRGVAVKVSKNFFEIPISNLKVRDKIIPWGGGGYFRLTPGFLFYAGVKSILKNEDAYVFYTHPWEFDPNQPRVEEASTFFKFRHYVNLKKTHNKLVNFIKEFSYCNFISCNDYLCKL